MSIAERAKTLIAESLSNYLLPDKAMPKKIDITVSYAQSSAYLCWDAERLEKIMQKMIGGEKP